MKYVLCIGVINKGKIRITTSNTYKQREEESNIK